MPEDGDFAVLGRINEEEIRLVTASNHRILEAVLHSPPNVERFKAELVAPHPLPGQFGREARVGREIDVGRVRDDVALAVPAEQRSAGHPERHLEGLHHLFKIVDVGQRLAHEFRSLEILISELGVVVGCHRTIALDQPRKEADAISASLISVL